jgi:hypothetical protein
MDESQSTSTDRADDGLRERNAASQQAALNAGQAALTSLAEGEVEDKEGKAKKTFGRTPDGTSEYLSCEFLLGWSWKFDLLYRRRGVAINDCLPLATLARNQTEKQIETL